MGMILLSHIIIALSSLVMSTVSAFWPSRTKVYATAGLIAATLASGTYLVISTQTPLLHVCMTGLVYLGLASSGVIVAVRRLAAATAHDDR